MNRRAFIGGSVACAAVIAAPMPAVALAESEAVWTSGITTEEIMREVWHLKKMMVQYRLQWVVQDQPKPQQRLR
jgi:hypothetical protein